MNVAFASLKPYINMPSTNKEISEMRQSFYNIAQFPKCIVA